MDNKNALICLDKILKVANDKVGEDLDELNILIWVDTFQECEQSIRIVFKRHKKVRSTNISNCSDDTFEEQLTGLLSFARAAIDSSKRDGYREEKILENVAWHHSRLRAIILKF